MNDYNYFDGGNPFTAPEKPFLLIFDSGKSNICIEWYEKEKEILYRIKEIKDHIPDAIIIDALEISGYREVEF